MKIYQILKKGKCMIDLDMMVIKALEEMEEDSILHKVMMALEEWEILET